MAFIDPSANSVNYKNMFRLEMGCPSEIVYHTTRLDAKTGRTCYASECNKFSDQNTETFSLAGAVVVCTRLSRQFWEQHPLWLFSVHK